MQAYGIDETNKPIYKIYPMVRYTCSYSNQH